MASGDTAPHFEVQRVGGPLLTTALLPWRATQSTRQAVW